MKMWIEYMKLKNYRQYVDEKIVFATPENKKKFTVLLGVNGSGKTNILNALSWCLYGRELHLSSTRYTGLPTYNTRVANSLKDGDSLTVEVEVLFREDTGEKIQVSRRLEFRKDDESMVSMPDASSDAVDGSRVVLMRNMRGNWHSAAEPAFVIRRRIPENIEEFFFFDGERLDHYFRDTSGESIKEAVFKISQIGLLEKCIEHLRSKRNDFYKTQKNLSPKAKEIASNLRENEETLTRRKNDLEDRREQKKEAEQQEKEYSLKLKNCAIRDVAELENDRVDLQEEVDRNRTKLQELEDRKLAYMSKIAPNLLSVPAINLFHEKIEESIASGKIPPEYTKSFINKLLKKKRCICGTLLNEGSKERESVKEFGEEVSRISDIEGELLRENGVIAQIFENLEDADQELAHFASSTRELHEDTKRRDEKLQVIEDKIKSCNVEEVKRWEEAQKEYRSKKEELMIDVAKLEERVKESEETSTTLNKNLTEELAKETKHQELVETLKFCDQSLQAAEKVRDDIMNEVRNEIEERTNEQFLKLIWKKKTYKQVKIDDSYNISVSDYSGSEALGTLSAGERQVLALSFVAAVNNVSGFNVPLVIDTPLGRISKEPRQEIAKNLPKFLEDKQVILLVTDTEYSHDVRSALAEYVGSEYHIVFKEYADGGEAKVIAHD